MNINLFMIWILSETMSNISNNRNYFYFLCLTNFQTTYHSLHVLFYLPRIQFTLSRLSYEKYKKMWDLQRFKKTHHKIPLLK